MSWSRKHEKCIECGTTRVPHIARGLCKECYNKKLNLKHRSTEKIPRGQSAAKLTKDYLDSEYCEKQRSLAEISKECGCSRQYIYKKMAQYGIPRRDKAAARELALDQGKLRFEREEGVIVTLKKTVYNESFFSNWTSEMAYVLGVIATDGNVDPGYRNDPTRRSTRACGRLGIAQKEPELLVKVLNLMSCDTKLHRSKERVSEGVKAGSVYYFYINDDQLYHRLVQLGITPRKSLTLKFPEIPNEYIRHFIRGCWDGDGTVYFESRSGRPVAKFVCGSKEFIQSMQSVLNSNGLPKQTICIQKYKTKRGNGCSFTIQYTGASCAFLFDYLYDGVSSEQYLSRKYILFKTAFDKYQGMKEDIEEYSMRAFGVRLSKNAYHDEVVRLIIRMRLEKRSFEEIYSYLLEAGVKCPHGQEWTLAKVRMEYWAHRDFI